MSYTICCFLIWNVFLLIVNQICLWLFLVTQIVGHYNGTSKEILWSPTERIQWPKSVPPLDYPPCGFSPCKEGRDLFSVNSHLTTCNEEQAIAWFCQLHITVRWPFTQFYSAKSSLFLVWFYFWLTKICHLWTFSVFSRRSSTVNLLSKLIRLIVDCSTKLLLLSLHNFFWVITTSNEIMFNQQTALS